MKKQKTTFSQIRNFMLIGCLSLILLPTAALADIAGTMSWPVHPFNNYKSEGPHMSYYSSPFNGYHMGEDINAQSGDECNHIAYAIGDGRVVFIQNDENAIAGKGKMIIVRYALVNGQQIDVSYNHSNMILVPWHDEKGNNTVVTKGTPIAKIGNTGGVPCHLHIEVQVDLSLPVSANPYYGGINSTTEKPRQPMTVGNALKYSSPSLLIDDRLEENIHLVNLNYRAWSFFTADGHSPSSLAYIENLSTSQKFSLNDAANEGLIYKKIYRYNDETKNWQYFPDIKQIVFEKGKKYAVYAFKADLWLNVVKPAYNYEDDRARMDMLHALDEAGYSDALVHTEEYAKKRNWYRSYDLSIMRFELDGQDIWVNQAHNVDIPTLRFTAFRDPETLEWTPWQRVDPNEFR